MLLTNDIFTVVCSEASDGQVVVKFNLNTQSAIFAGHFPGNPVVPGACMLQLVKDVLEDTLQLKLQLAEADIIKFMSMIVPAMNGLELHITYKPVDDSYNITAKLIVDDKVCFKFQGRFIF